MSQIIRHFDALCNLNLKVIPLRVNSKAPIHKNWAKFWNKLKIRNSLIQNSNLNIGLLLGDIIDVEGDSEEANQRIMDMTKDYPHPMYISSKSIHHLFISPEPDFKYLKIDKIEFRGCGHQSVLPPSKIDDIEYQWLKQTVFPIPEMPLELKDYFYQQYYLKYNNDKSQKIKPNHTKCVCDTCNKEFKIHCKRLKLETKAFQSISQRWKCKTCRSIDIRPACRLIKKNIN